MVSFLRRHVFVTLWTIWFSLLALAGMFLTSHTHKPQPVAITIAVAWITCSVALLIAGSIHYWRAFGRVQEVSNPIAFTIWTSVEVVFWLALLTLCVYGLHF